MLKEKDENLIIWWKSDEATFPMLSLLASELILIFNHIDVSYFIGRILSTSVMSASVERQFLQIGLVYYDRRMCIKPSLLNNMLLIRSKYKMGLNDL